MLKHWVSMRKTWCIAWRDHACPDPDEECGLAITSCIVARQSTVRQVIYLMNFTCDVQSKLTNKKIKNFHLIITKTKRLLTIPSVQTWRNTWRMSCLPRSFDNLSYIYLLVLFLFFSYLLLYFLTAIRLKLKT